MRINIVYELNHREYYNCILLQRELVRRGYKVFLLNKTEDIILSREHSITIIPNSYRTIDVQHYQYMFNTRKGLIIIYPNEQVLDPASPLPKYYEDNDSNMAKRYPHLCWGKEYFTFLQSLGYDMKFSRIVGPIQLDLCRKIFANLFVSREILSYKYLLPSEKKWLLFISAFVLDDDEYFAQRCNDGSNDISILKSRRLLERKTSDIVLEWFDRFLDTHIDYIIIYRKHPVENLSKKILHFKEKHSKNFFCIPDYSIKEWILNCDRLVTWNSTSVAECYVAGKNLHVLRPVSFPENAKKQEYLFYKKYRMIKTYEQFESDVVNDSNTYSEEFEKTLNSIYDISDSPSFIRIADAIEDIYEQCNNMTMERNFTCKRWIYLVKHLIPLKILIKKIYQKFFLLTGISFARQNEKKYALYEWTTTAINKSQSKEISMKIDELLNIIHNK